MELTHTTLKFNTQDGVTHEIDFKDNKDKFIKILRANANKETIKVQVKVKGKIYELLNTQLYF